MHPALAQIDHRPWPMPDKRWAWQQTWLDLCFIHFEADPDELRRLIPSGLQLELFENKAWIGIVPFRMEGVTKRGWPAPSILSDFFEINVRTYVTDSKKSGVWFLSLDASNYLAVWVARIFFHLPYYYARITARKDRELHHYRARRGSREFVAEWKPGESARSEPGTFSAWATERYCLYSLAPDGRCFRAEVQHPKWSLLQAVVNIETNTLAEVQLGAMHPAVLFSARLDVVIWALEQIN